MATPVYAQVELATTTVIEERIDPLSLNCYLYLKSLIPELPNTVDIIGNTIYPVVGEAVVMTYGDLKHYAYILKVTEEGIEIKESNFHKGEYSQRFLSWAYLITHNAYYWRVPDNSG